MPKKYVFISLSVLIATVILVSVGVAIARERDERPDRNVESIKRVIAHTDEEVNKAISVGCVVAREARTMKSMRCPEAAAQSLSLPPDIQVFALDIGSNNQIGATTVHSAGNTGSGRKIVILDTGYNYNHPELSSSYLGGKDFVNDDNDPMDDEGHGSHVAGIITADGVNSNAKGVAPNVSIISGKVLDSQGSGFFSDVVAGIYWAVDGPDGIYGTADDFGADAINLSLGTSRPYTYKNSYCDTVLPDLTTAVKYAFNKGIVVVAAAGNSGSSGVSIPGCISYSTTVGAVNSLDKIASFSSRGKAVDISAPGVNIFSSILGSSYASWSGTSMATPMVSGVVALIKSAHTNYTSSQVENALFKTAKDLGKRGKDTDFGYGRVNAAQAVR